MRKVIWGWIGAGVLAVAAPAASADDRQQVLDCMNANLPSALRVQDIELRASRPDNPEAGTLRGKLYLMRSEADGGRMRATLRISEPDYLDGASYLIRQSEGEGQDGMYVFLPSVKRVRRISGEFADGPLLGTNISYYDFKQMQQAVGDASSARERDAVLSGRPVYVLTHTPSMGAGTRYSLVRSWVDQQTCVPLQIEFYEAGTVRKRLTGDPAALRQSGGFWYLAEARVDDLRDHSSTVVRIPDVTQGAALPARLFDPKAFYLGR